MFLTVTGVTVGQQKSLRVSFFMFCFFITTPSFNSYGVIINIITVDIFLLVFDHISIFLYMEINNTSVRISEKLLVAPSHLCLKIL